jgi:hypothetical protein
MTTTRIGSWVAVGLALGTLAGVWNLRRARGTGEPAAAAAAQPEATGAAANDPAGCQDDPAVAVRSARVEALRKEAESLFYDNSQAHFRPPKALPARFSGKAIEETLHNAILAAGVDAQILGTDCSEYPCVTRARARSDEDLLKIKHQFFDQPAYGSDTKQLARSRTDDPEDYLFGATIYQSTDPRDGEIFAALSRRLGFARLGPGSRHPGAAPRPLDTIGSVPAVASLKQP